MPQECLLYGQFTVKRHVWSYGVLKLPTKKLLIIFEDWFCLECLSLAICIQEMCKIMLETLSVNWQKLDPRLVRS